MSPCAPCRTECTALFSNASPPAPTAPSTSPGSLPRPQLPLGRLRLRWDPTSRSGWHVTTYLGLPTAEVLLGSWPAAPYVWPRLIRPTLYEVTGLCTALSFSTDALDLSNRLARV